jgi:hypothetical protein
VHLLVSEKYISSIMHGATVKVTACVYTAVAQWLRCCAANRKVAGSIPGGVTGNFH